MRPLSWTELKRIAEDEGFSFDRQRGSHYVMTKPGHVRPVVIPCRKTLSEGIVMSVAKTLGLNRRQILDRLEAKTNKAKSRKAKTNKDSV